MKRRALSGRPARLSSRAHHALRRRHRLHRLGRRRLHRRPALSGPPLAAAALLHAAARAPRRDSRRAARATSARCGAAAIGAGRGSKRENCAVSQRFGIGGRRVAAPRTEAEAIESNGKIRHRPVSLSAAFAAGHSKEVSQGYAAIVANGVRSARRARSARPIPRSAAPHSDRSSRR